MKKTSLFENYINENIDAAYRFAYTYAKNKEDAEDILNESVVKALRSINSLEDILNESVVKALRSINSLRDPEKIKPWFYRIIANTALTHIKSRQKIVYLEYEDMENLDSVTDDYSNLNFNELIEKLDPKYKSIIVLRFFENMTIQEVASVLDLNENTVKTRLYKALKMLRVEI